MLIFRLTDNTKMLIVLMTILVEEFLADADKQLVAKQ